MKQKELSVMLKVILILCLLAVLLLGGWVVPSIGRDAALDFPEYAWLFWPCLSGFWVSCVPVLAVLGIVWRMSDEIRRDNSFCRENARRLKWISLLALLDTGLYLAGAIFLLVWNALHPGVALMILALLVIGVGIAVIAAILSHLVQKAADLKADQDLTI